MARTQPKKHRLLGFAKRSNSATGLATPPGRSQARAGDTAPVSETSGVASQGRLARMRRFFHRSNKCPSTTAATETAGTDIRAEAQVQQDQHHAGPVQEAADTNTGDGAQEQRDRPEGAPTQDLTDKLDPEFTSEAIGKDIDAAVKALDDMNPISRIGGGAVKLVGWADTAVIEAQSMSDTYLKPFKVFNQVVSGLAHVHPYARIALVVLTSASQLIIHHANLDNAVSGLLDKVRSVYEFLSEPDTIDHIESMRDTLVNIARAISESVQFITNYFETKNFWLRAGKKVFSETQTVVDGYVGTLGNLMQQYRDRAVRDTRFNTYRMSEDLNLLILEGMTYADGAGLNTTKKCLDGTRREILQEIINWISDPDVDTPRILWLHGQAGRGKSAIAHTIASSIKDAGGLGACFCFARDRQIERREEKILATIARDLADRDPAFRRALADIVAKDRSLKTTPDVMQQWQHFILEPLSRVDSATVGNMVVVIDALDESGPDSSREHILRLLTSKEAARLPSCFRILLTSRPLPDIERVLRVTLHVRAMSLDDIPAASAEQDIRLYVANELRELRQMGTTEIQSISRRSDGLFEWARLACRFIKPNRPGRTVMERYREIISPRSGGGGTLLDIMYRTILADTVPEEETTLERFRSVMQQIMSMSVPLHLDTLNKMRKQFPSEEDHFDMFIILEFMAPLLSGISDRCSVVRPLHASFYDFLDHPRSGVYCVGASGTGLHHSLTYASLHTLSSGLKFNICVLESSYLSNSEVADLQEKINNNISPSLSYSCQYWADHLQKTMFDLPLATLLKDIIGSEKILFWLETLGLLNGLGHAMSALASTITWLQGQEGFEDTLALAQDGIKFLQNFSVVISHSTPHLYISALPFTPSKILLARMLMPKLSCIARISAGGLQDWPVQVVLQGHTSEVWSVGFSSDGKRIVSGSYDKTVRVWDAEGSVQIGSPLEGHTGEVVSVGFSIDGKRIVSGSSDKTVRIWDAERGVQIGGPLEGHTDWVMSVGFSSDGKRIVSGSSDNSVRIWDAERGVQIGSSLEGHTGGVKSVGFSSDGKRIVSGPEDNTVRIWDAERGMQIGGPLEGHTGAVWSVGYSPDSKRIISGSEDDTVRIWDAEQGAQIGNPLEGHTNVVTFGFSPDSKQIVSGSFDNIVRVWDAENGAQIGGPLDGHTGVVNSVGFSFDGKRIVSGSEDKTVRVWDAERGVHVGSPVELEGHTGDIWAVGFSPDGKRIVSGSSDKTVRVWDAERGFQINSPLEGHTGMVNSAGFSSDGKRIVSGSADLTVRVWDAESGVQVGHPLEGHAGMVNSVGFSSDGKRIVSGSYDKTVRVWDAEGGVQIGGPLEGHTSGVKSVEFSSDGKRIVSGSDDKTVRVWDAEQGVQIGGPLEGHTGGVWSVGFSSDGGRIVSGSSDNSVRIWDAERGVQIGSSLEGHTGVVNSVGFSPDGKRIVSGSEDKTVRVWDVERGVQIGGPLEGHTDWVMSVAFSSDGKRIVSGSSDKTVRVWDAERGVQNGGTLKRHTSGVNSAGFSSGGMTNPLESGNRITMDRSYEYAKQSANTPEGLGAPSLVISSYPISFSPVSSHALHDVEQLLDGLLEEEVHVIYEPVKLFDDGWVRGPKGRLLLRIPPTFWKSFYSMWNTVVIPKGSCIELDLSQMVHGNRWHQCFKPAI